MAGSSVVGSVMLHTTLQTELPPNRVSEMGCRRRESQPTDRDDHVSSLPAGLTHPVRQAVAQPSGTSAAVFRLRLRPLLAGAGLSSELPNSVAMASRRASASRSISSSTAPA